MDSAARYKTPQTVINRLIKENAFLRQAVDARSRDAADVRKALLDEKRRKNPPTVENVREGLHDLVAALLHPDDARSLRKFIARPLGVPVWPGEPDWDRIDEAVSKGLADYDGPDGDDGRDFTPPYEP